MVSAQGVCAFSERRRLSSATRGSIRARISEVRVKNGSFSVAKKTQPTLLKRLMGRGNSCIGSDAAVAINPGIAITKSGEDFVCDGTGFPCQGVDTVMGTDEFHH